MQAYAVFDGGGVKGAALAGCISAAHDHGIELVGYGGTSAGSIIALMAAIGFSSKELEKLVVEELSFLSLLDDGGASLLSAKHSFEFLASGIGIWRLIVHPFQTIISLLSLYSIRKKLGLYSGKKLASFLDQKVRDKLGAVDPSEVVSFQFLMENGCKPLKVVASDVTNRRAVVFSSQDPKTAREPVVNAVLASSAYPLVFAAREFDSALLLDGGLASNLPSFLFADEYRRTGYPILAFDLAVEACSQECEDGSNRELTDSKNPGAESELAQGVKHEAQEQETEKMDFLSLLIGVADTALEASDGLLRSNIPGVEHITIPIPRNVKTLDFDISMEQRRALYNTGYVESSKFFGNWQRLKYGQGEAGEVRRRLQSYHGPPSLYDRILEAVVHDIEHISGAENVRAHVMLPTNRTPPTRIVVYSFGMDDAPDADLELGLDAGCSGRAWKDGQAALADLEEARKAPEGWGMSVEQANKVPVERKLMLSVPIRSWISYDELASTASPIIGVLSVDSESTLESSGWIDGNGVDTKTLQTMYDWANVISKLLRG